MYEAKINDKWYIIAGNKKMGPYRYASWLTFSPDGKILVYEASINGEWYIIAGKEKIGPHDSRTARAKFSSDGKVLAYSLVTGLGLMKFITSDNSSPYLFMNGQEYIGSICNDHILYIKDNKIYKRTIQNLQNDG